MAFAAVLGLTIYKGDVIATEHPITPQQSTEASATDEQAIRTDERANVLREVYDKVEELLASALQRNDCFEIASPLRHSGYMQADTFETVATLITRMPGFKEIEPNAK